MRRVSDARAAEAVARSLEEIRGVVRVAPEVP